MASMTLLYCLEVDVRVHQQEAHSVDAVLQALICHGQHLHRQKLFRTRNWHTTRTRKVDVARPTISASMAEPAAASLARECNQVTLFLVQNGACSRRCVPTGTPAP